MNALSLIQATVEPGLPSWNPLADLAKKLVAYHPVRTSGKYPGLHLHGLPIDIKLIARGTNQHLPDLDDYVLVVPSSDNAETLLVLRKEDAGKTVPVLLQLLAELAALPPGQDVEETTGRITSKFGGRPGFSYPVSWKAVRFLVTELTEITVATVEPGQQPSDWRLSLIKILGLNKDWIALDNYCPAGALSDIRGQSLEPARMSWWAVRSKQVPPYTPKNIKHVVFLGQAGLEYMRFDAVSRLVINKTFGWRLDRQTLNKIAMEARLP